MVSHAKAPTTELMNFVQHIENRYVKGTPIENAVISNDIQSLADLNNSFAVIRQMQVVPITKTHIIMLVIVTAMPVLPLALTMMRLSELLKMLAGLVF